GVWLGAVGLRRPGRRGGGGGPPAVSVGARGGRRAHRRCRGVEGDVKFHSLGQPVGRPVILKMDGAGLFSAHVGSVGEEQAGTFLLIYRQIASCFNRFPGSRNPLYGCADNIGRNVMTVVRMLWVGMAALLAATFGAPAPAVAQDYPNQRVTIVVPFGAGSVTDIMARILADELAKRWNQQVVVENRPGLAGTVGVAKAAPDGYTLMLTSNGHTVAALV